MPKKNLDFEINFLEGLLERSPLFFEAMAALADLYTKRGFYDLGLSLDRKLAYIRPDDPLVHYNLACSLSLVSHIKSACCMLKKAINFGYRDIEHMKKDKDLDNLKKDKCFSVCLERISRKTKEKV